LLSPILPFTTEEIWQSLPETSRDKISIQLSAWPEVNSAYLDKELDKRWQKLLKIREEVTKALEIAREKKLISSSLQARVELYAKGETYQFLEKYRNLLPTIFIVSQGESCSS